MATLKPEVWQCPKCGAWCARFELTCVECWAKKLADGTIVENDTLSDTNSFPGSLRTLPDLPSRCEATITVRHADRTEIWRCVLDTHTGMHKLGDKPELADGDVVETQAVTPHVFSRHR